MLCLTVVGCKNYSEKAATQCSALWLSDENINLKDMSIEYMTRCCNMIESINANMDEDEAVTCVHRLQLMKQTNLEVQQGVQPYCTQENAPNE